MTTDNKQTANSKKNEVSYPTLYEALLSKWTLSGSKTIAQIKFLANEEKAIQQIVLSKLVSKALYSATYNGDMRVKCDKQNNVLLTEKVKLPLTSDNLHFRRADISDILCAVIAVKLPPVDTIVYDLTQYARSQMVEIPQTLVTYAKEMLHTDELPSLAKRTWAFCVMRCSQDINALSNTLTQSSIYELSNTIIGHCRHVKGIEEEIPKNSGATLALYVTEELSRILKEEGGVTNVLSELKI